MSIKACNSWNGASHKKFYDQHLEFIYIYILHAMPNLQRYPWNLNLTKNLEDSVRFFCARNVFISASFSIGSCKQALRKLHSQRNENKQFKQKKTWISNSCLIRQSFQGYRCKSCIIIFARRIFWNYANSPFKLFLSQGFYLINWKL